MTDIYTQSFSVGAKRAKPTLNSRQIPAFGFQQPRRTPPGDTVHFAGSEEKSEKGEKGRRRKKAAEKIKRAGTKTRKWSAAYALSLLLIPGGMVSSVIGFNTVGNESTTTPIVRMTNPDDLSSPIVITGPDAVLQQDVQRQKPDNPDALKPDSEITAEQARDIAEEGRVLDILQEEGNKYQITVSDSGHEVTVNATLTPEQLEEIRTLKEFGSSQNNPLEGDLPTALPDSYAELTAPQLLGYTRAGMLLQLEKDEQGNNTGNAIDNAESASTGKKPYSVILTDGKKLYEGTVYLTPQQYELLVDNAEGQIAQYRGTQKSGGGANGQGIFLILNGLGLMGLGTGLGFRKRRQRKNEPPEQNTYIPEEAPWRAKRNQPELATAAAEDAPVERAPDVAKQIEQKLPAGFTKPSVKLEDMAGLGRQLKEDIEEVMEVLTTDEETVERLGIEPIKGVLLYGPPGTGKTMMAEAVAHETGRLYKCISASSLGTTELKGNGAKKVRQEFAAVKEAAKTGAPILLQIDEIDSLFGDRTNAHDEDSQTLNEFLTQIDQLHKESPNVVVMYTTNHLKKLDGAAIRNGRVDYKIKVPLPSTREQRLEILELYKERPKPKMMAEDVDLDAIAEMTHGFSPIDLRQVMAKATIRAKINEHEAITQSDLLESVKIIDRQRKKEGSVLTSVERPKTTFNDLGGLDEIIPRFRDIAKRFNQMAESANRISAVGDDEEDMEIKPILLEGDPGTGKTELGRAMANEAKCNFMYVNGSEFEDGIIGHGAANVRKLFEDARENAPTIIFIDEADAAFRKRGGPNSNEEREATLNQLLTEINGLSPNDGVFVMAATNRADIMDTAALSRFESVSVPKPSHPKQRRQILDIMVRKRPLAEDVDLDALAEDTSGYSGRDLKGLLQIAARLKRDAGRKVITREDVDNAVDIHELGEKSAYPGKEQAVKLVGIHEIIGHGLLTMAIKRRLPDVKVRAVTMEARRPKSGGGQVLGFVRPYFPDDITYTSVARYLCEMMMAAGGRASERVIVGKEQEGSDTSGGGSDYQKMEQIAVHMIQQGMIPGFSPNQQAKSRGELTQEEKKLVDDLMTMAEKAAEVLIKTAAENNPEKMVKLVENGIEAKTVRNEDAEALFTNVLTEESDWEPLYEQVDQYISAVVRTLRSRAENRQETFDKLMGIETEALF